MIVHDRTAVMNRQMLQSDEFRPFEKIPHLLARRMVQDDPGRPFVGFVVGQQDDRPVERAIPQRGIRDQQLSLKLDRLVGLG